jgi:hypothetical protein
MRADIPIGTIAYQSKVASEDTTRTAAISWKKNEEFPSLHLRHGIVAPSDDAEAAQAVSVTANGDGTEDGEWGHEWGQASRIHIKTC